jgi:hypothetical protein
MGLSNRANEERRTAEEIEDLSFICGPQLTKRRRFTNAHRRDAENAKIAQRAGLKLEV